MPKLHRKLLASVVFALCILGCQSQHQAELVAGAVAPDFVFKTTDGELKKLSDFRGRVVVLTFWASWCDTCKSEIPSLIALSNKLSAKGVVVLAVASSDSPEAVIKFQNETKLPYVVGYEESSAAAVLYKLTGVPESFILDKSGKFTLILDPANGDGVTRIIGPRDWASTSLEKQILALL